MDNSDRIGKIEAIALLTTVIVNNVILNIPPILLNHLGSGAWLNVIYMGVLSLVFICIICKLYHPFVQADIVDISEFLGGKTLKWIIGILYILLFIVFSSACLRYFADSLQTIYFNDTPLLFLILLLLIPVVICCKHGLRGISGTNLIFIPIIVISFIVLLFAASQDFKWQRLFPIFGYGTKNLFLTQLSNFSAFNIVGYLFFIKPYLKKESHFNTISIFCIILSIISFFLSTATLLMTFPFITQTDETLSLYLLTRLVSFGKFLQRVDAMFIFLWILNILSFISFNVFIICNIIKKLTNIKFPLELSYGITSVMLGICLSFSNTATLKVFNRNIYRTANTIIVFVISFIIFLLAYFKNRKQGVNNK